MDLDKIVAHTSPTSFHSLAALRCDVSWWGSMVRCWGDGLDDSRGVLVAQLLAPLMGFRSPNPSNDTLGMGQAPQRGALGLG
jgi:hypothetical protein